MGNPSGMPELSLKAIKQMAGADLSDVRVHYNSSQSARVAGHAYAHGTDIHLAPGQERHLAHEAWHVVQQKGGRVSETGRSHIGLNKDEGARKIEADLLAKRTPV